MRVFSLLFCLLIGAAPPFPPPPPPSATVECYNPRTNEWTYVAKMNEPHYGHAGTVYGGYMYISGEGSLEGSC